MCQLCQPCSLSYFLNPLSSVRCPPLSFCQYVFPRRSLHPYHRLQLSERAVMVLVLSLVWPTSLIAVFRAVQNQHFPILWVESFTDTSHCLLCLHTVCATPCLTFGKGGSSAKINKEMLWELYGESALSRFATLNGRAHCKLFSVYWTETLNSVLSIKAPYFVLL